MLSKKHQEFAKYAGKDLSRWMRLNLLNVMHCKLPNLPGLVHKVYSKCDPPSLDSIMVKVCYGGRIVREFSAMEFLRVHSVIPFRPQAFGGSNPRAQIASPTTLASGNEKTTAPEKSRLPTDRIRRPVMNRRRRTHEVKRERQPSDTPTKELISSPYLDKFVFHMTKISNLASIAKQGFLWSDSEMRRLGIAPESIANEDIKARRRERSISLDDQHHSANSRAVGDFVPFYFRPRSPMLYAIMAEKEDSELRQCDIVYLATSIRSVCRNTRNWCFSDGHAIKSETSFFSRVADLEQVDWKVIESKRSCKSEAEKRRRQAEFLVLEYYPFSAIEIVAGRTREAVQMIKDALRGFDFKPSVEAKPMWYIQEDQPNE